MGVQLAHSGTRKLRRHRGLRVATPGLEPATPRFFSGEVRRVRRREIPGNEGDDACPACRAPPSADPTPDASSPGLTRPASDRGNPWAVAVASVPSRSRADRSPDHDWLACAQHKCPRTITWASRPLRDGLETVVGLSVHRGFESPSVRQPGRDLPPVTSTVRAPRIEMRHSAGRRVASLCCCKFAAA